MRCLLLFWAALLLSGCSSTWEDASPGAYHVRSDQLGEILGDAGTWAGVRPAPADPKDVVEGRWHLVQADVFADPAGVSQPEPAARPTPRTPAPVIPPPIEPEIVQRPAPTLPVPVRRRTPPPPKRGKPLNKTPKQLVREHYLDNPTTVRAAQITFYCPHDFLKEVRLKAAEVKNAKSDRRVASGGARLTCRELTLVAEQIIIRVRRDADAELQIAAMGNVELVSRVRNQAVRETGLKSLILRQDQMMPLR